MKNIILLAIGIVVMAALLYLFRYDITVNSPLVVKLDRWTGATWVASSGVWMDIGHEGEK
ncbi:MAG: hypothetical protein ISS34_01640 [Candidatus Omnitrophica bacterium]|nr:hypothetical protein [Candidatus Omnitrophota bacterium]